MSATQDFIDEVKGCLTPNVNSALIELKNQDDILKSRIDNLSTLEEGSTTGDAELIDTRVGVDGTIYANAGTAVRTQVSELKQDLVDLIGFSIKDSAWNSGYYNSSGVYLDDGISSNFTTSIINKNDFEKITIIPKSGYIVNYVLFNGSTFISRGSWSASKVELGNSYNVAIMIATESTGTDYNLSQMLTNYSFDYSPNGKIDNIENEINEAKSNNTNYMNYMNYMNKIICSDSGNKIIHFSVDDTWICIKDITDNQYTSIFENSFLNALKTLHDTYGICVTLNTFNTVSTDSSYSISNVPTRYQAEFQANKSWLKFAFHAESDVENYNTATGISTSYDTFVNAIYTLTGDYDCIDRITRLGYFGGTLENVLAIKNKEHGIIGLLCADDTRISYYLTEEQNSIVQKKGKYIDSENELFMIKTLTRNLDNDATELNNNPCYQKYVEVFMHEYEFSSTPIAFNGFNWEIIGDYYNAYPSLLLN